MNGKHFFAIFVLVFVLKPFQTENSRHFCPHFIKNNGIPMHFQYDPNIHFWFIDNIAWSLKINKDQVYFDAANGQKTDLHIDGNQIGERQPFCCVINNNQAQLTKPHFLVILFKQATNKTELSRIDKTKTGELFELNNSDLVIAGRSRGWNSSLSYSQLLNRLCIRVKYEHGDSCDQLTEQDVLSNADHKEEELKEFMYTKLKEENRGSEEFIIIPVPPSSPFQQVKFRCFHFSHAQVYTSISETPNFNNQKTILINCSKTTSKGNLNTEKSLDSINTGTSPSLEFENNQAYLTKLTQILHSNYVIIGLLTLVVVLILLRFKTIRGWIESKSIKTFKLGTKLHHAQQNCTRVTTDPNIDPDVEAEGVPLRVQTSI